MILVGMVYAALAGWFWHLTGVHWSTDRGTAVACLVCALVISGIVLVLASDPSR